MLNVVINGIRSPCWPWTVLRSFEVPCSLDKAGTTWYFATAQVTSNFPCRAESAPIKTGGDGSAIVRAQLHSIRRAYPLDWYHLVKCKWPKLHEVKQVDMSVKMCISCSWRKREGTAMEDWLQVARKTNGDFGYTSTSKDFELNYRTNSTQQIDETITNFGMMIALFYYICQRFFFKLKGKYKRRVKQITLFY